MARYATAPPATMIPVTINVMPAATQEPSDANPAASVEVAIEGILPTVVMAAIRHHGQVLRPAA